MRSGPCPAVYAPDGGVELAGAAEIGFDASSGAP